MARLATTVVATLVAPMVGRPEPLPVALVARWPELGRARWRRGGLPPRVGGWCLGRPTVSAITLYRTIWLAPGARLEPALLLHEVRHVEQFAASRAFPLLYAWESWRRGYHRNRYELDAVRFAARRLHAPHAPPSTEDV